MIQGEGDCVQKYSEIHLAGKKNIRNADIVFLWSEGRFHTAWRFSNASMYNTPPASICCCNFKFIVLCKDF